MMVGQQRVDLERRHQQVDEAHDNDRATPMSASVLT